MSGRIRVGIGGWTYPPWRGRFYPPALPHAGELAFASRQLTTLEINGTFYRHQTPEVFAAWRDAVPDDFLFTVKAHRATTHLKELAEAAPAIERFLHSGLAELGTKLGPILWQLPHTKKFDAAVMQRFIRGLPATLDGRPLRHAVEARHASFLDPEWPALAASHNLAVAIVESDKQALRTEATADFIYARLQYNRADTTEGYPSDRLDAWHAQLQGWKRDCFVLFISGDKERAPDSAAAMLKRLQ